MPGRHTFCAAVLLFALPLHASADATDRASGSGKIEIQGGGGTQQILSFSARAVDDDGDPLTFEARGHAHIQIIDGQQKAQITADVICMVVFENSAVVKGIITKSTSEDPGFQPGQPFAFFVQDNGEGKQAQPDLMSNLDVRFATASCSNMSASVDPVPLLNGNVQVTAVD